MKPWIGFLLFFLVAFALTFAVRSHRTRQTAKHADPRVYFGLRNLLLHGTREKFGVAARSNPNEPWGVLMDWGVEKGTATVVALDDGTASIYLSGGGGYIGGGQSHESIRAAARQTVAAAKEVLPLTHATNEYPIPQRGQVAFYLLTDSGVFTASASDDDLRNHTSPLSKLGDAAQNVITQYSHSQ